MAAQCTGNTIGTIRGDIFSRNRISIHIHSKPERQSRSELVEDDAGFVRTDTPQPPTISPTPPAFTFPLSHNLSYSPYSSGYSSLFIEPELFTFPPPPNLSYSAYSSWYSSPFEPEPLISPLSSPRSPSAVHKHRKPLTSLDAERRPKKGDDNYVKRPENAFILFRRKCVEDRDSTADHGSTKKQRQADLSKSISQLWKSLSALERQQWEELAKEKRREHERLHPGYIYRPQRLCDKDGKLIRHSKSEARRDRVLDADNGTSIPSTATVVLPGQHCHDGRPAGSASTQMPPAPYHTMQIPNVYGTPPYTDSSSMHPTDAHSPRISRLSSHPGHVLSDFDHVPGPSLGSPTSNFHSNMQSPDRFASTIFNRRPRASEDLLQLRSQPSLPTRQSFSPSSFVGLDSSGPSSPPLGPSSPPSTSVQSPDSSFSRLCSTDWDSHVIDPDTGMQLHQELDALKQRLLSGKHESRTRKVSNRFLRAYKERNTLKIRTREKGPKTRTIYSKSSLASAFNRAQDVTSGKAQNDHK
ncbi:hypothetical protein C8J56DRAFT_954617 [Mycena floridula]|nr:hypothetical protein C8J56DRAFT_954617 [Mycena floridula]